MNRYDPEGEGDFDLLREDGYNFEDILNHDYLDGEGNYLGPKPSPRPVLKVVPPPLPMASTKGVVKKHSGS